MFLKKTPITNLSLSDLHIGNLINVHSRQLNVVGYADSFTEAALVNNQEHTLMVIKPDAVPHAGSILDAVTSSGLTVVSVLSSLHQRKPSRAWFLPLPLSLSLSLSPLHPFCFVSDIAARCIRKSKQPHNNNNTTTNNNRPTCGKCSS